MVHNPYSVTPRKPLTNKQRLQLLIANGGKCCICGQKIEGYRERWDDYDLGSIQFVDEHVNPLWLTGTNDRSNRGPAHVACARQKTSKEAAERAKSRRISERHFGARKPKRPTEYTRLKHKFKRTVDGRVVPR